MGIRLLEHKSFTLSRLPLNPGYSGMGEYGIPESSFDLFKGIQNRSFRLGGNCFTVTTEPDSHVIKADYYIGLDWLGKSGRYVYVEPKINLDAGGRFDNALMGPETPDVTPLEDENKAAGSEFCELDYLGMLLEVLSDSDCSEQTKDLVQIDWDAAKIKIKSKDDKLTPFLIIQFLKLLKTIVQKGLKKAYYKIQENLSCKIKGKILVTQNLKQNVFKNRLNSTVCEYQVFGEDCVENRFLNMVFNFVNSYVQNNPSLFAGNIAVIENMISYCRPAFERIGEKVAVHELRATKDNPFFKEYPPAINIGQQILKRFAFNISQTAEKDILTPPFWIDMPRLFELYVYQKLLQANPFSREKIVYQFSTYGNALDVLIKNGQDSIVIDAKYKLHYKHSQVHADMRQVAGYARLSKVLKEISKGNEGFDMNGVLPCLIIYPDIKNGLDVNIPDLQAFEISELLENSNEIQAYHKIYKLGIKLPLI